MKKKKKPRMKNDLTIGRTIWWQRRSDLKTKNRGRTKNAGAPIGQLNTGWVIGRSGIQICTKKNTGFDLEEHEDEEVKLES